ncbi:MAG: hypothetical protein IPL78_32115 [Chloroflexi bacterium]|nr:hypothetical protein [Chloroflexota bacterium]
MLRRLLFILVAVLLMGFAAACQSEPIVVTRMVEVTAEVTTISQVIITTTPVPPTHTAIPPTETAIPEPTATNTLSPIRATAAALNALVSVPTSAVTPVPPDDWVGIINQACTIVSENYVRDDFNGADWDAVCADYATQAETVTSQTELWVLLEGLIAELNDNHSRFVSVADFNNEFDLPTTGAGIPWPGMTINPAREDDRLLIWYVCDVGPAASAGLQRGDVILAIDGQTFAPDEEGFDRGPIFEAMYGNGKTSATFTVLRGPDNEPEDITLNYGGAAGCDGWQYGLLSETPRIGYIRVPDFGGASDTNVLDAIEAMEEVAPLDGLVVDVRHNPGGNSDRTLALFTEGIFGTTGPLRAGANRPVYRIPGPVKWNSTTPVAVLTDGASHSAAEYFAIVMQLSGRAIIVGYNTAGNTEGITGFNVADGSIIRLAVQILVLPDGSLIEDVGVTPDILVPLGEWGLRDVPDNQLQAAYDALLAEIE